MKRNISIILAPFGIGGPNDAAKDGPAALMKYGIKKDLENLAFNVKIINPSRDIMHYVSRKQINKKNRIKNIESLIKVNEWLAKIVSDEIKNGSIPLTIGGDHSLAIGTIAGVAAGFSARGGPALGRKPAATGVLWIDRHFDAHSPKNTTSWRSHGMPVSVAIADKNYDPHPDFQRLLKIGHRDGVTQSVPKIKPENLVHFGIGEKSFIKPKTKWFLMEDIDTVGINKAVNDAINYLLKRVKYIYIAWDVDALSITGTGTHADDQLTLREGLVIARAIYKKIFLSGRLAGFEMMEVAPRLEKTGLKGQTASWAGQLIATSFGDNLFNNFSRMTLNINIHAE